MKVHRMHEEEALRFKAPPELAASELRRLRRRGLRAPKDHVIVEAMRLGLVVGPAALAFAGLIEARSLVFYYLGYFAMRWFAKYLKPRILNQFGPEEWRNKKPVQTEVIFDSYGFSSIAPLQEIRLAWGTVPVSKVGDGMIFRVGPELSVPVTEALLPDDWSMSRFEAAIAQWRSQGQDK